MDMDVNTEALNRASECLKKHTEIIENATDLLIRDFERAHERFASRNYDRTKEAILFVKKQVQTYSAEMADLCKKLKKLENCVVDYKTTGYRG